MSASTNSLVAKIKKFAVPGIAAAAVLASIPFVLDRTHVHAASYAAPMDDNSVAALTALDNAMEAVAARVTPAVVNVSVTSHGSAEEDRKSVV